MSLIRSAVAFGETEAVFDRLTDPAVRMAVWTRSNPCREDAYPGFAQPTLDELSCLPDWLAGDIRLLGGLHRRLAGVDWRVRLETAEARTCPGFHEDAVRLRLLVTYRGPGTEWTPDSVGGAVQQIPTGAVAALKGRTWPSDGRILHRSAKASRRNPRWILAMDAAEPSEASAGTMTRPVLADA